MLFRASTLFEYIKILLLYKWFDDLPLAKRAPPPGELLPRRVTELLPAFLPHTKASTRTKAKYPQQSGERELSKELSPKTKPEQRQYPLRIPSVHIATPRRENHATDICEYFFVTYIHHHRHHFHFQRWSKITAPLGPLSLSLHPLFSHLLAEKGQKGDHFYLLLLPTKEKPFFFVSMVVAYNFSLACVLWSHCHWYTNIGPIFLMKFWMAAKAWQSNSST